VSRARLQRDRIVRRALEIADAEGLDAVSFRRLAADLGVTPMALYRHLADRSDLLVAMTDLILAEIELPEDTGGDWADALRDVLRSAMAAYARHPAAPALTSSGWWTPRSLTLTETLVRLLTRAGFTEREGLVIVQRLSDAALAEAWAAAGEALGEALPGFPGLEAALRQTAPSDPRTFGVEVVIAGAQALAAAREDQQHA
jgi:TetR/AcrR family tetracycline transcriptional repressor